MTGRGPTPCAACSDPSARPRAGRLPSRLFWESVRDPSLRRRLLAQVFGDADLAADESGWPALGVADASADGKYWAYRTVNGQPRVGSRFEKLNAVGLVVREVATGRI